MASETLQIPVPKLRRLQFSLQTVLALIAAAGLGLSWWRNHQELLCRLDLRQRQIRDLQVQIAAKQQTQIPGQPYFTTPEDLAALVQSGNPRDFKRANWGMLVHTDFADKAIEPLTVLLCSHDDEVRERAAWLLGQIGSARRPPKMDPIPALVASLNDPSPAVRAEVIYAIGNYGRLAQDTLPRLEEIMRHDQSEEALAATRATKSIDESINTTPRLRELFFAGNVPTRRNAALLIMETLPRDEAKQLLLSGYQRDADETTRDVIAQAMNRLGE